MIMPAYTEIQRLKVEGKDTELSIAQYQYQTITTVQKDVARTRIRYGCTKPFAQTRLGGAPALMT
ncbi:hypothetical protein HGG76_05775 [Ochrobactrum tritici]|uniref:Uncharacterized protein n=1 Tax=Brucella tritici TaxID=94626 RepID=A0A7X6JBW9_9HYPH|nr:hypothetical protein [Brucella tritici]